MKAQIMTADFVTSLIVFAGVLIFIGVLWAGVTTDLTNRKTFDIMTMQSLYSSELLVKGLGNPENWTANNVQVLGLAESGNVLDPNKVDQFENLTFSNYFKAKSLLGLTSDFYFEIDNAKTGSVIAKAPDISLNSYSNVASVTRYALLNGTEVKMLFAVIQ